MVMDMIYIILGAGLAVLALGFFLKDYPVTMLASIFLLVWGVYVLINGMSGYKDLLTDAIGIIVLCIAAYIMIKGGYEGYKNM